MTDHAPKSPVLARDFLHSHDCAYVLRAAIQAHGARGDRSPLARQARP